jgi:hypothetical protein
VRSITASSSEEDSQEIPYSEFGDVYYVELSEKEIQNVTEGILQLVVVKKAGMEKVT